MVESNFRPAHPSRFIPLVPSLCSNQKMTRFKRTHTRHSTPARCKPRIHAHSSSTRNEFRYHRHPNLKRKHSGISYRPGNSSEDTYLSLLRSIQETENDDDDASSNGTNSDASSERRLEEEWDEETTLVEMLGCPYSNLFPLHNAIESGSSGGLQRKQRRTNPSETYSRVCGHFPWPAGGYDPGPRTRVEDR